VEEGLKRIRDIRSKNVIVFVALKDKGEGILSRDKG
jgi:hypothetical protein